MAIHKFILKPGKGVRTITADDLELIEKDFTEEISIQRIRLQNISDDFRNKLDNNRVITSNQRQITYNSNIAKNDDTYLLTYSADDQNIEFIASSGFPGLGTVRRLVVKLETENTLEFKGQFPSQVVIAPKGKLTTSTGRGNVIEVYLVRTQDSRNLMFLSGDLDEIDFGQPPADIPEYTIQIVANQLRLLKDGVEVGSEDLSLYLDDSNLARLVSGVFDPASGMATFMRDDNSNFMVDFSGLFNEGLIDGTNDLQNTFELRRNESGSTSTLFSISGSPINFTNKIELGDINFGQQVIIDDANRVMYLGDWTGNGQGGYLELNDNAVLARFRGYDAVTAPTMSIFGIDSAGEKAFPTVEWVNAKLASNGVSNGLNIGLTGTLITTGYGDGKIRFTNGSNAIEAIGGLDFNVFNKHGNSPFFYGEITIILNDGTYRYVSMNSNTSSTNGTISFVGDTYDQNGMNNISATWDQPTGDYRWFAWPVAKVPNGSNDFGISINAYGGVNNGPGALHLGDSNIVTNQSRYSITQGRNSTNSGRYNLVVGDGLFGNRDTGSEFGQYNVQDSDNLNPRRMGVGVGTSDANRLQGFEVRMDGLAYLPISTNTLIDRASNKALVTKEWVQANLPATSGFGRLETFEITLANADLLFDGVNVVTELIPAIENHVIVIDKIAILGNITTGVEQSYANVYIAYNKPGYNFELIEVKTDAGKQLQTDSTSWDIDNNLLDLGQSPVSAAIVLKGADGIGTTGLEGIVNIKITYSYLDVTPILQGR